MSLRMLIDARHPEETRVAVINGQRIEEFDFEAADRKQLKGNIYLAKVTRVEPSLQAAFVEYGGNRHGFLAFSEIHPDYYQIPREDREALLREEAEYAAAEHDDVNHDDDDDSETGREGAVEGEEIAETGGQNDEPTDALRRKRQSLRRRYKIQEVIHRRQVLLIQVVKEERGNKGAALTTYLSLAGRYCVLMPNTAHGGGISRKISNIADRKRLKAIMSDLKLPQGMGAIVRTAGLKRSSDDIRRDFDYLTRLWDEIREKTLASSAPSLIHQDSDLIKRAIRDIYHRDIDQVLVEGAEGFADASRFMSMLMPGHTPKVAEYTDAVPLFQRFGVEQQLEGMYQPVVQLKSGGYIVINPTEALVSIDINSGRSTREYGIEDTATKTNLEAAEEIGRQLRLRDMAGLVVIDFIDMDVSANNRRVEKAMKDALRNDRARIQIGRISSFGLMEMSRQRLRTGILEASTHICPMCEGTGTVRSVASAALAALRALEAEALRGRASEFTLRAGDEVAVYILNKKRIELAELEELYGVTIITVPDEALIGPNFAIDAQGAPPTKRSRCGHCRRRCGSRTIPTMTASTAMSGKATSVRPATAAMVPSAAIAGAATSAAAGVAATGAMKRAMPKRAPKPQMQAATARKPDLLRAMMKVRWKPMPAPRPNAAIASAAAGAAAASAMQRRVTPTPRPLPELRPTKRWLAKQWLAKQWLANRRPPKAAKQPPSPSAVVAARPMSRAFPICRWTPLRRSRRASPSKPRRLQRAPASARARPRPLRLFQSRSKRWSWRSKPLRP